MNRDLTLNKGRRSRTWQSWTHAGRAKLLGRFQRDRQTYYYGNGANKEFSGIKNVKSAEEDVSTHDSSDEELDVIVSSWKRNYMYFQKEQQKRAAAAAATATVADEFVGTIHDEEDSILHAILEEDGSLYDGECDEGDCEDEMNFDEITSFSVTTHEEWEFQEFVRRQEQKLRDRPFLDRFMDVLGIGEEDDIEDDATAISDSESSTIKFKTEALASPYSLGNRRNKVGSRVKHEKSEEESKTSPCPNDHSSFKSIQLFAKAYDELLINDSIKSPNRKHDVENIASRIDCGLVRTMTM